MLRRSMLRFVLGLALMAVPSVGAASVELEPRESLLRSVFRPADGDPRSYLRLQVGAASEFLFCGQGRLNIYSRSLLEPGADAARYELVYSLDGAKFESQRYRATRVSSGTFDPGIKPTSLRRIAIAVERGCHTLRLALAKSTDEVVGVRLTFAETSPTKRAWQAQSAAGGSAAEVLVQGRTTPYRLLPENEMLRFRADGPAWIRMLVRSTGSDQPQLHHLDVLRDGAPFRAYVIESRPSSQAALIGKPYLDLSRADEVVFAVGEGRHSLAIRSTSQTPLLIRAQVAAKKSTDTDPLAGWSGSARLGLVHDDNILRYSDKFIDRFDRGSDPDRFRVESLDDLIWKAELSAERQFAGLKGRAAGLRLGFEQRSYQDNSIKDWNRILLAWSQRLSAGKSLQVRASYLPEFYVRHLRDSDLTGRVSRADTFQSFDFSKQDLRASLSQPAGRSSTWTYHLGAAQLRHSDAFREFDSDNLFAGVRFDHFLSRTLRWSAAAEFTHSDAQGFDGPGETKANSDDTDPTYQQTDLMTALRIRIPTAKLQTIFLQAELGLREYTTDKPSSLAPLHFGREDDLWRVYASWQIDFSSRYSLTVFGQFRERSSTAPVVLDVGVEKNYEQAEFGTRVTWRF